MTAGLWYTHCGSQTGAPVFMLAQRHPGTPAQIHWCLPYLGPVHPEPHGTQAGTPGWKYSQLSPAFAPRCEITPTKLQRRVWTLWPQRLNPAQGRITDSVLGGHAPAGEGPPSLSAAEPGKNAPPPLGLHWAPGLVAVGSEPGGNHSGRCRGEGLGCGENEAVTPLTGTYFVPRPALGIGDLCGHRGMRAKVQGSSPGPGALNTWQMATEWTLYV